LGSVDLGSLGVDNTPPTVNAHPEAGLGAAGQGPSNEQILSHLELILASGIFSGAARQQRLLRHLVEKRLQGAAGELKEYTLGVEVFDRGEDFDPRLDPIVRVEASRLRSRLQKYYDSAGATDKIRVTLPRGAYVPSFEGLEAPAPREETAEPAPATLPVPAFAPPPPSAAPASRRDRKTLALMALAGALIASVGGVVWLLRTSRPRPAVSSQFVNFRRITNDQVPCVSPSFSPDGKSLVYTRREAGRWDLYERDLNSLAFTELTPDSPADNVEPAWSPDGKTIAFRSDRDGGGIFLLDARTRAVSRLTDSGYLPAWSPNSAEIAFSTETFSDPAESSELQASALKIVDVKSKRVRRLGSEGSIYDAVQPAWSPDGSRIAFWGTDRDGERDIWTVAADSADGEPVDPVRVTHDAWTDWSAAWSPDGRYLYFSSDRGGSMNLWRVRINQRSGRVLGQPEAVMTPSPYSGWISFAAGGKKFAYVHRLVSSQLFRAPFDPEKGVALDQKVQLTFGELSLREPDVSPDGRWIAARMQDPQEDLALIRPNGTDLHRITNDSFSDRSPHWSPDGKQIVFLSNRSGRFDLWSIRPDGTGLRQLTEHGSMPYVWTPNGTLVGFPAGGKPVTLDPRGAKVPDLGLPSVFIPMAWSSNRQSVVGRMRADGFSRQSLFVFTPSSDDYWEIAPTTSYPSTEWLKDGRHLLFSQQGGIFLADVETHKVRPVADTTKADLHSHFGISPDGRNLFFISSDDEEDIWVGSRAGE
jgi:eukaryotic-like serine/threonine-protein kinase